MSADPLAMFWRHWVLIAPQLGEGAAGPVFGQPVGERGNLALKRAVVTDSTGRDVSATASLVLPAHVPEVPVGSQVTLPAEFGGGTTRVVAVSKSQAGPPFPDTQVLTLE
ncbi:hypothetical protein [Nocardia niigatensis]